MRCEVGDSPAEGQAAETVAEWWSQTAAPWGTVDAEGALAFVPGVTEAHGSPLSLAGRGRGWSDQHFEKAAQGRTWGDRGREEDRHRSLSGGIRVRLLREASGVTPSPGQSPDGVRVQERPRRLPLAPHTWPGATSLSQEATSVQQLVCWWNSQAQTGAFPNHLHFARRGRGGGGRSPCGWVVSSRESSSPPGPGPDRPPAQGVLVHVSVHVRTVHKSVCERVTTRPEGSVTFELAVQRAASPGHSWGARGPASVSRSGESHACVKCHRCRCENRPAPPRAPQARDLSQCPLKGLTEDSEMGL